MQNTANIWSAPITRARLLEEALHSVNSGVLVVDEDGIIRYANTAACDGFGWRSLDGVPLADLVPLGKREKHSGGFEGFVRSPAVNGPVCVNGLHRSGKEIPVEVSVSYSRVDGNFVVTASIDFREASTPAAGFGGTDEQ
jgi:PAS domain S-box-containing protein